MDCIPFVPSILCTSCGTFIGNKFLQFNMLIECGSTRQEAFEALDLIRYCCRLELVNPIVLTRTVTKDSVKVTTSVESKEGTKETAKEGAKEEFTGKYLIPKKKPGINRLTSSKGNEIAIASSIYNNNINALENFRIDLLTALETTTIEDIPFVQKEVDIGEVFGDNFLSCLSEEQAGSGIIIDRIHRVYKAT